MHLTVEQTDRYRGIAFLIFRFFALRQGNQGAASVARDRAEQARRGAVSSIRWSSALWQLLSTLLLWPFFGLTPNGLMLSALLTLVIVLHELGHMAAYRAFGHKTVRMIFMPLLGGIAIGGRPYNSCSKLRSAP